MVATIQQIIGKINPKLYAENGKELLKKYGSIEKIPAEEVKPKTLAEHTLTYDSSSENLEPVYFFILDSMNDFDLTSEKIVDNFTTSPGSGHFSEMRGKATAMQQQATKILADTNTVLRSILNIVYDLKEFKIRLQSYDDFHSKDNNKTEAATLSLKQIWMDKVDITKGNSSIKAMALGQAGFQTLIDAFLAIKNEKDVEKIDLNDRVKRILLPRIQEFNIWIEQSEKELRKRYEIERTYLKSQVNSLKLYSRWAKPYLKAAQQLEMKEEERNPALVKAFNTIILELVLLGKNKLDVKKSAIKGELPEDFQKLRTKRNYYSCVLIDFNFRGIPQRISQQSHYAFGGRAEVTFKAYALNDDEIKKMDKELEKSEIGDVLKLIEGSTTESLEKLQDEINLFLEEKTDEEKAKSKDESNPFLALVGHYDKTEKPKEKKQETEEKIKSDNWIESQHLRPLAAEVAVGTAFDMFDMYKKAHDMPSYT
jgi:hypothetical protein